MRSLHQIMAALVIAPLFTASVLGQMNLGQTNLGQTDSSNDPTMPPPGEHPVLTVIGRGVQIYACRAVEERFQWVFVGPEARLFTKSEAGGEQEIGSHGDGPIWIDRDGSSVHGQVLAKQASPDAGSVPWLLLKSVSPSGTGVLSAVEYIRRSDTAGGVAPVDGCNSAHMGNLARMPYTATYSFYSSK